MTNSHQLLQEIIDVVRNGKKLSNTTYLANSKLDEFTIRKLGIPKILTWLFVQDFPGDTTATKNDKSFSNKYLVQVVNETPELQKYFQIKDGTLAFADSLSQEDAMDMLQYVKKNYRPQVDIDFLE